MNASQFFIGLPPLNMADLRAPPTHAADSAATALNLLSLPTDIRRWIYDILFQQPFRVVLGEKWLLQEIDRTPQSSQLLETCHQLHDKAVSIAYRSVTMTITKGYSMFNLREVGEFEIVHYIKKLVDNLHHTIFLDLEASPQVSTLTMLRSAYHISDALLHFWRRV